MQIFKDSLLTISLKFDCFHSQWAKKICIADFNRHGGYATSGGGTRFY